MARKKKEKKERVPVGDRMWMTPEQRKRRRDRDQAEREAEIQRLRGDKTKSDLQRETVLVIHAKKRRIRLHTISEILGVYRGSE